jgi:SOS response regulatory protein OraA/RecX
MTPLTPHAPHQRTRVISVEALRRQALARLHKRLRTVDELIRSLESYERVRLTQRVDCAPIIRSRKCS